MQPATDDTSPSKQLLLLGALVPLLLAGGPLLIGEGVDIPDDGLYYAVACWEWLRTAVTEGRSIWFVPGKLGGVSLYSDVVPMGPFYPFCWLTLILPVVPALGLSALLHAAGTLLAIRWLALLHGASPLSATLAGAALVAGPVGLATFQDCQIDTWPAFLWFPMVLACLERLRQAETTERTRWITLGAAAVALLLLGSHLRLAATAGGAIALWALLRGRDLPGALAVGVLGLLGGAVGFVPPLLEARIASDGASTLPSLGLAADQALGLDSLPGIFAPTAYVLDRDVGIGVVLGLALLAFFWAPGGGRDTSPALRRALGTVEGRMGLFVLLLVAAGTKLPFVQYLFAPLILLSHPVNLVYPALAAFPAAALAAIGLDRLLAASPDERAAWLRGPAGLVLGLLLGAVVLRALWGPKGFPTTTQWTNYLVGGGQALAVLAAAIVLLNQEAGRRRSVLLVALALLDLSLFAVRGHTAVPSQPLHATGQTSPAIASLVEGGYLDLEDLARGFDSALPGRSVVADAAELITTNPDWEELGDREAYRAAGGLEAGEAATAPEPKSQAVTAGAQGRPGGPASASVEEEIERVEVDAPVQQAALLNRSLPPHYGVARGLRGGAGRSKMAPVRVLDFWAPIAEPLHDARFQAHVLTALFGRSDGIGARSLHLLGLPVALWDTQLSFRIEETVPPCYSPSATKVVPDAKTRVQRLLSRTGPVVDPALLEREGLPAAAERSVSCSDTSTVQVGEGTGGIAVLRERWHPGWSVRTATGASLTTFPVNQMHLGIALPAGPQELRARFRPPGLSASLALSAGVWALLLGLGLWSRRKAGRALTPRPSSTPSAGLPALLGLGLLLYSAAPAQAATLSGTVDPLPEDTQVEVWVTSSLDLSAPGQPAARAQPEARTGRFSIELEAGGPTGKASGRRWLFLRQSVFHPTLGPITLIIPHDLHGFDAANPPQDPRLRAASPLLARLRAEGKLHPLAWVQPLLIAILIFGVGWALRAWMGWRIGVIDGAREVIRAAQGLRGAAVPPPPVDTEGAPPGGPLAHRPPTAPASPSELRLLGVVVALAAAVRLPTLLSRPLDLLEHTYGPGSVPIVPSGEAGSGLLASLIQPSSIEVTHPPLYHWLLTFLLGVADSEAWLRLPAFLCSVAGVLLAWRVFRRFSPAVAIGTAAALAMAAPSVHFGADATPYAWVGLVALGSTELLLSALETGRRERWWLWSALLCLGFLSHYTVALFGLAQGVAVLGLIIARRRRRAWLVAGRWAIEAGLGLLPLSLLWCVVHFGSFQQVALDTRLFADVYLPDPGALLFGSEFFLVCLGLSPDWAPAAVVPAALLVARGLVVAYRRDSVLAGLLLALLGSFLAGIVFFHANLVVRLDGRVFYGFRWVAWSMPFLGVLAVLGALGPGGLSTRATVGRRGTSDPNRAPQTRAMTGVFGALGAAWGLGMFAFLSTADTHTTSPDYRKAAAHIRSQLQHRDAVATLPLWGQRGPLTWYLSRNAGDRFEETDGVLAWNLDDKAVFLEAIDEGLPFQSSARNQHFDRLWLARVDERMFGRAKFDLDLADQALSWADQNLVREGTESFGGIELIRYRRAAGRDHRAPPVLRITAPELEPASLLYQEPNTEACIEPDPSEDGGPPRWELNLRVARTASHPVAQAEVHDGRLEILSDELGSPWRARVLGGPCTGGPPVVLLRWTTPTEESTGQEAAHPQ